MTTRDPRRDPRAGDVLLTTKAFDARYPRPYVVVVAVLDDLVWYSKVIGDADPSPVLARPLSLWRDASHIDLVPRDGEQ